MNKVNIFERLRLNRTFLGMTLEKWRNVLLGNDEENRIKTVGRGILILSGGEMIKCISHYYCPAHINEPAAVPSGDSSRCYKVQKQLIPNYNGDVLDCRSCHLYCLEKRQKMELGFLREKKRRK